MIEHATKQAIEIVEPPTTDEINVMRVTKFKEKIAKTIEEVDLGLFEKMIGEFAEKSEQPYDCLLYTSPSPRDKRQSRMPSSA